MSKKKIDDSEVDYILANMLKPVPKLDLPGISASDVRKGIDELTYEKARGDAPRYRVSDSHLNCVNCKFGQRPPGFCDLFKFPFEPEFICDSWEPAPIPEGLQQEVERMGKNGHPMERKTVPAFGTKILDPELGMVEHIFAVFGNVDDGFDIAHPGSFTKTLAERGNKIRVLDNHNADSVLNVIGKPILIQEIPREALPQDLLTAFPEATGGVKAQTQFLIDTPEGMGAFKRIKAGAINEWSFGYDALDVDFSTMNVNGEDRTVRNLRTVKLYEYSPVLWGMNQATVTLGFKAVTGFQDLPLTDRQREWDATAADRRVRAWADTTDNANSKYAQAFFWHDSESPELFGSYKLGFADVIDGRLTAIPRGVFAVAAVLQGGRGGVDIPQAGQDRIKGVVGRYYSKMRRQFEDDSIIPPWDKAALWDMWASLKFLYGNGQKPIGVLENSGFHEGGVKNADIMAALHLLRSALSNAGLMDDQLAALFDGSTQTAASEHEDEDERHKGQAGGSFTVPPGFPDEPFKLQLSGCTLSTESTNAASPGNAIRDIVINTSGTKIDHNEIVEKIIKQLTKTAPDKAADNQPEPNQAGPDKPPTSQKLQEIDIELKRLELLEV